MKTIQLEKGNIAVDLLIAVGLGVAGFSFSDVLIQWAGEDKFVTGIPFLVGVIGLALTPLYALYKKLDDLKSVQDVTETEKVRLDYIVKQKVKYQILIALFYILVGTYLFSARIWPESSLLSPILAKVACALVVIVLWSTVKTFQGFFEVYNFEAKLRDRARKSQQQKSLLEKMAAKKS